MNFSIFHVSHNIETDWNSDKGLNFNAEILGNTSACSLEM